MDAEKNISEVQEALKQQNENHPFIVTDLEQKLATAKRKTEQHALNDHNIDSELER